MLLSTGAMAVSASIGALACGGGNAVAQNAAKAPAAPGAARGPADAALADAAYACIAKGQACLSHCIAMLAGGDTMMAGCAPAVHDMHAVMPGLAAAASSGSRHIKELARVAMEFCKDCEAECRKHAAMHAVCKECADACAKTIAACQRVIG